MRKLLLFIIVAALTISAVSADPSASYDSNSGMIRLSRPVNIGDPVLTRTFTWPDVTNAQVPIPTETELSFTTENGQTFDAKSATAGLNALGLFHIGGGTNGESYTAECLGNLSFVVPKITVPFPIVNGPVRFTVRALRVGSILYKLNAANASGLSLSASVNKYFLNVARETARLPTDVDKIGIPSIVAPTTPVPHLDCKSLDAVSNRVAKADAAKSPTTAGAKAKTQRPASGSTKSSASSKPSTSAPAASASRAPGSDRTIDLAVDASKQHAAVIFAKGANVIVAVTVWQSTKTSEQEDHMSLPSGSAPQVEPSMRDGSSLSVAFQESRVKDALFRCVEVNASSTIMGGPSPGPHPAVTPWSYTYCPTRAQIFPASLRAHYRQNQTYGYPYFPMFPVTHPERRALASSANEALLDLTKAQFTFDPASKTLTSIAGDVNIKELSFDVYLVTKP